MMNPKMLSIYIVLIFGLLTSCFPTNELINTPFTATSSIRLLASPTPIIPVTTSTETAIPPLVSIPTLASEDAFSILRNYLKNKPPCQLPCWGGIMPGKSALSDVQKQLTAFSGIADRIYFGQAGDSWIVGNLDIDYPIEGTMIEIRNGYMAPFDAETILYVNIGTQSLPKRLTGNFYGDENYNALLSAYTLPQILTTYGPPAQIFITAEIHVAEPTAPDFFIIRLLYPDLGVFVRYTMPAETKQNTYEFCPSESLIYLDLLPQGFGENYKEFFKQIGDSQWNPSLHLIPFYKSTEDALGITNEEFYRLIVSSPNQCFESPISIWPGP